MKKVLLVIMTISTLFIFNQCKKKVADPVAEYVYYVVRAGDTVEFPDSIWSSEPLTWEVTEDGEGSSFTIFPGDGGRDYALKNVPDSLLNDSANHVDLKNIGYGLTKSNDKFSYTYAYPLSGVYKMVLVANSYGNRGEDFKSVVNDKYSIRIVDTVRTVKTFTIVLNASAAKPEPHVVVSASPADIKDVVNTMSDDWTIQLAAGKDITAVALKFDVGFAKLTVNGKEVVPFTKKGEPCDVFDLSTPLTFVVTSPDGYKTTHTLTASN